jgi:hypothetical protein
VEQYKTIYNDYFKFYAEICILAGDFAKNDKNAAICNFLIPQIQVGKRKNLKIGLQETATEHREKVYPSNFVKRE